jgi:triosephosphate isomerase
MAEIRALVAGNWKMNGLMESSKEARDLAVAIADGKPAHCTVLLCPPFTLLAPFSRLLEGSAIALGGQDCHDNRSGAHTGDVSAEMLKDAGCEYVIVGHSERRADHGEGDALVGAKAFAAQEVGLKAIVCIGETQAEREAGQTLDVVGKQLAGSLPKGSNNRNTLIAYEPVWAIGTGLTPSPEDVSQVHNLIRQNLTARFGVEGAGMQILYGGSVKPSNAGELMAVENVNGALVGGASLRAADLNGIIDAYR